MSIITPPTNGAEDQRRLANGPNTPMYRPLVDSRHMLATRFIDAGEVVISSTAMADIAKVSPRNHISEMVVNPKLLRIVSVRPGAVQDIAHVPAEQQVADHRHHAEPGDRYPEQDRRTDQQVHKNSPYERSSSEPVRGE
jgi:hypothetical protein